MRFSLPLVAACVVGATLALVGCGDGEESNEEDVYVAPAETTSPAATLRTFIDACNDLNRRIHADDYVDRNSTRHRPIVRNILDCLDTSQLPDFARQELSGGAACAIKEILDRIELPPENEWPGNAEDEDADGSEVPSRWRIPGSQLTIELVTEGPRRNEYQFNAATVASAPEVYDDMRGLPYRTTGPETSEGLHDWYIDAPGNPLVGKVVEAFPTWFRRRTVGMPLWKWFGLVLVTGFAIVTMAVTYRFYQARATRMREESKTVRYCVTIWLAVAAMFVPLVAKHVVNDYFSIRGPVFHVFSFLADLLFLLAGLVVIFGIGGRVAAVVISFPSINPQGLDAQFIRIITRLLTVCAVVIVFLEGGRYLGFPVTTLLASAGVGGLAIALAAQDTLKNTFGTVMLMADKPFRPGERIIFNDYDGVVEDIGLRSTRLRLLNGHQVTIPNDELARSDIENVGRRPYIRRVGDIRIPLDTPPEKVNRAVEIVREAVQDHEGMTSDYPPRVFFNEFNDDSFNIRMIYWYTPPNYWDFLATSERINVEIFTKLAEQGIRLSPPLRMTTDNGVSPTAHPGAATELSTECESNPTLS
jgi:MscS family membrane protein